MKNIVTYVSIMILTAVTAGSAFGEEDLSTQKHYESCKKMAVDENAENSEEYIAECIQQLVEMDAEKGPSSTEQEGS